MGKLFSQIFIKLNKKINIDLQLVGILNEVESDSDIGKAVVKALIQIEANLEWIEQSDAEVTSVLVYGGDPVPTTTQTIPVTSTDVTSTTHSAAHLTYKTIEVMTYLFCACALLLVSFTN